MEPIRYDLDYLRNPEIFAVGRLDAVSDHDTFASDAEARAGQSSLRQSLDGMWKFAYAERPADRPVGFEQPTYDCSQWAEIRVPGHIQLQGYGVPQYVNTQYPWDGHEKLSPPEIPERFNPVGSYTRTFYLPQGFRNHRVHLVLHGVETACFVWVNGVLLGYAEDSFTPSRFDVTDALWEGENKLAIEVFRFSSASWLEDQDFWRFSGIFRSVELQAIPRAHVEDLFVHAVPEAGQDHALLTVEAKLSLAEEPFTLTGELLDAQGNPVDRFACPARPATRVLREILAPQLWSAERPYLYTLRLTLLDGEGRVLEVACTEVGFRRIEIQNQVLLLNGKRLLLYGADRHEFSCHNGRAIGEAEMLWDIRTLKRMNLNAVRTSHYPNNSLWYRLCDRYGIYLMDEANLETHGTWMIQGKVYPEGAVPSNRPEWLGACLDRAESMLERDKNHPSVILWSCGNESYGGSVIYEMSRLFRRRDPGRPVHYEGIHFDPRYPDTSDVASRMYPPAAEIPAWLDAHPEKPLILCEYSHAMGNSCGGLRDYMALMDRHPRFQGGFIWDWIDQAILTTLPSGTQGLAYGGDFDDQPTDRNFCGDGLVFANRVPTPKLQEVKFLYQPVRILLDARGVTLFNRNLFDDLSGYRLTWMLTRDGLPMAEGSVEDVATQPGERRTVTLPLPPTEAPGEYALLCELRHREAPLWAEAGYVQMQGQTTIAHSPRTEPDELADPCIVTVGDVNAGVYAKGCEALFSYAEGGLVSLRRLGRPAALNYAPRPSLFRAPIDNDVGNDFAQDAALWWAFSELSLSECEAADVADGRLTLRYRYRLPALSEVALTITYEALAAHRVRVRVDFPGGVNLPDLPALGLSFRLPKALHNVCYYGLGPEENGVDRSDGAILGVFETTAGQNLTPYLKPQDCGNRSGVRWMTVTDDQGFGIRIRSEDRPLEISVLPHSQAELATALHQEDLPPVAYTWLDVAMARRGVGGDDSWGAPVLESYRLHADQALSFRFFVELAEPEA